MRTELTVAGAGGLESLRPGLGRTPPKTVRRLIRPVRARWLALPLGVRLAAIALLGCAAAAAVGYLASVNRYAAPQHIAVATRVTIVLTLVFTGIYAQTNRLQARMGSLLLAGGFFSAIWLLNGAGDSVPFTIGALASGAAPTVFCWLVLSHPQGRLPSRTEERIVLGTGRVLLLAWLMLMLLSPHAPFTTPLMRCGSHCPDNVLFLGLRLPALRVVLELVAVLAWAAVTCAAAWQLARRTRAATDLLRSALRPVMLAAALNPILLVTFLVVQRTGLANAQYIGAAYVSLAILIPLAILSGLSRERMFTAAALADFIGKLARNPSADPQALIAGTLGDPSLQIAYRRPQSSTYVTLDGRELLPGSQAPGRAVTFIERGSRPVAAVTYNADLRDQERFIEAAASAALMRLESARLEADLRASTADLQASRIRLVEAAHEERRRIERDLHDTVQQQLVGVRIKLGMAADALADEPQHTQRMLSSIEDQIDDVLATLRNLARGIYPSLLSERGIAAALTAAAQRLPIGASVQAKRIGRFDDDIEVAVYFCCLEALQNVVKHGGSSASATVRLRRDGEILQFEVTDTGVGFDQSVITAGSGLTNMRDRAEAIGGTLRVSSIPGAGTRVRGRVPATLAAPA